MTDHEPLAKPDEYPHGEDLALIPARLAPSRDRGCFEVTAELGRFDGVLYGGTGAGAAVMAMEAATQRDAIWVATQFVSPAYVGEEVSWSVTTLAEGRRIAQLQVVATVGDRTIFCALGATAHPRPNGLTGQYEPMPEVSAPEKSAPLWQGSVSEAGTIGFHGRIEFRQAAFARAQRAGRVAWWARLDAPCRFTRAGIAFVADMVPVAVARGAGKGGAGSSLDNSLRFAAGSTTEWVLLELHGEMAAAGYGHGSLLVWSPDGRLLATGSQTASMTHLVEAESGGPPVGSEGS